MKKVYVGLSGGVDSSVSAYLLKQQGYHVVGIHMKNWSQDIGGFECPWREDYQDAKRLAAFLDIEFKLFDFEKEYKDTVVDYMLDEFKIGRTPNPDVMCNQEIKFRLFLDASVKDGADYIATGHYARVKHGELLRAKDDNKDQTYFLYRVQKNALLKTLFPLGDMSKPEVRALAEDAGLPNAGRKESMGICFVGKVGIRDFLKEYVDPIRGNIIDDSGNNIGMHDGAIFYTIGQRSGLGIGGGLPYYVTGKDMEKNEVYVTKDIASSLLWTKAFKLASTHWISGRAPSAGTELFVRTRHRAELEPCTIEVDGMFLIVTTTNKLRAITPGQSAVLYTKDICLGGGIITGLESSN